MKKFTNEREDQWINEGARLKQLREEHKMSRAELARLMNTSATRLARLENGEGVRDARILSSLYEYAIKYHNLEMKYLNISLNFGELYEDWAYLMGDPSLMEE